MEHGRKKIKGRSLSESIFGQIGEDKAATGFLVKEGPVGPG
jgi:hypothetical protein